MLSFNDAARIAFPFLKDAKGIDLNDVCRNRLGQEEPTPQVPVEDCPFGHLAAHFLSYALISFTLKQLVEEIEDLAMHIGLITDTVPDGDPSQDGPKVMKYALYARDLCRGLSNRIRKNHLFQLRREVWTRSLSTAELNQLYDELDKGPGECNPEHLASSVGKGPVPPVLPNLRKAKWKLDELAKALEPFVEMTRLLPSRLSEAHRYNLGLAIDLTGDPSPKSILDKMILQVTTVRLASGIWD